MGCWARHSHQSPVPEAPSAPGCTAASASQRTGGEGLISARLAHHTPPCWGAGSERASHVTITQHAGRAERLTSHPPVTSPPSIPRASTPCPQEDPVHSTILASVLISARTQSGQSRSPQNRNLCMGVRQAVRREGLRWARGPPHYCSSRTLLCPGWMPSSHLLSLTIKLCRDPLSLTHPATPSLSV